MLVTACARLNPSFGDGDANGGTDGDSASSTRGTTRGSDADVASDTKDSGSDSDSDSDPSDTVGQTTGKGTTTDGVTSRGETSDSEGETRGGGTGDDGLCTFLPDVPCATLTQDCGDDNTCAPWSQSLGGALQGTYCVPPGPRQEGQTCTPVCRDDSALNCGFDLACDVYSGGPAECRRLCDGTDQECVDSVCLMYEGLDPRSLPLSFCAGECDPVSAAGGGCGLEQRCAIVEPGVTQCVPEGVSVSNGASCTDQPCAPGLICAPGSSVPDCETDECCAPACSTVEECPDGFVCTLLTVPFADSINAGFCRPTR